MYISEIFQVSTISRVLHTCFIHKFSQIVNISTPFIAKTHIMNNKI